MSLWTTFAIGELEPLTEKRLTQPEIEQRIRTWQGRLGLQMYRIFIDWSSHPDEDIIAEVNAQDSPYDRCGIRFCKDVTEWPGIAWGESAQHTADEIIVHELLHVHMSIVDRTVVGIPDEFLHRDAAHLIQENYADARERFIDRLAVAFVAAFEEEPR